MRRKKSIIIDRNISMICLELNWFFYDPSHMLKFSEFVWTLRSLIWVVYINFLLINATDRSKISSNHHRIFFDVSLYHISFFTNTPYKINLRARISFMVKKHVYNETLTLIKNSTGITLTLIAVIMMIHWEVL